eukprot:scaffold320688_cov19-Tisochrysis_lutea.AAC.1
MAEHLITCPGQYKQCCPLHHPAVLPDLFISPVWLSYIWMHRIAKDSQVIYGSMRKRQAGCEGEHDKKKQDTGMKSSAPGGGSASLVTAVEAAQRGHVLLRDSWLVRPAAAVRAAPKAPAHAPYRAASIRT